jgi:excinuclease UvrABC helicase subunit UvrB
MDLFGSNKSLDDMIKGLNEKLKKFGFEPMNFDMDYSSESGFDDNGMWSKTTYTSSDGTTKIITIKKNDGDDESKKQSKISSNDLKFLEKELSRAVESQNFEYAVELRDKIKTLKNVVDEIKSLESQLKKAINDQNFELCIELRNKLNELKSL